MPIVHDLRYALRTLLRTPVFTVAALLSLTVGIAGSSAVFSLVDALAVNPVDVLRSE